MITLGEMGEEKYLEKVEAFFRKSPVVSFSSIERIVNEKKKTGYTKQLVRNLLLKGKIKKLTKGFYSLEDNAQLVVFCFKPAYFGLQDALSFHDLWEQETIPVIITSRRVRTGLRKVLGVNILVRKIDKRYLFGFEYAKEGRHYFPYSDVEKTFIDMVYFKETVSKEVLANMKLKIDREKLNKYLVRYPKLIRSRVLACLYN